MRSEREKMFAGERYDAMDPQLVAERCRARELCVAINDSHDEERALRKRIIVELLGSVGDGVWIEPPFYCDYGTNITLGCNVYFNFNCVILDPASVTIGDNAMFGPAVQIYTATHPIGAADRRMARELAQPIEIGSDVWVGGGAIILPCVHIGARSVIGAGSVVTRDIPADVFAAGNPCRVIRNINEMSRLLEQ